jgi:hypothetical protein
LQLSGRNNSAQEQRSSSRNVRSKNAGKGKIGGRIRRCFAHFEGIGDSCIGISLLSPRAARIRDVANSRGGGDPQGTKCHTCCLLDIIYLSGTSPPIDERIGRVPEIRLSGWPGGTIRIRNVLGEKSSFSASASRINPIEKHARGGDSFNLAFKSNFEHTRGERTTTKTRLGPDRRAREAQYRMRRMRGRVSFSGELFASRPYIE